MMKVITVDCKYVEPEIACSYLIIHEDQKTGQNRGVFVECNTNFAIPHLIEAARAQGLEREQIDGLIITHVHLDHAGGAGLFLKEFKAAKLYAHPRAAKHAIDPSKLIAGATQVYGEVFMQKMYGTIIPAPADRVVILQDGDSINWGNEKIYSKHTRGHANHHLCVWINDAKESTIFTGDSFGVTYPVVNRKHLAAGTLIMTVSTSPTDFDGAAALETIDWIEKLTVGGYQKMRVAPTHFGFIENDQIKNTAQQLKDQIRFSIDMVARIRRETLAGTPLTENQVFEHIKDWNLQYFANQNIHLDAEDLRILGFDYRINAQGLRVAASKA